MDTLLSMRNLSIELFKGKKVAPIKLVEDINLTIGKKQNFGIVGESGCGKSITCSAIPGLLSYPLSLGAGSSIRFMRESGETEITALSKAELRKMRGKEISMIFQEPMTALDPMYTIEDQIFETLHFHTNFTKKEMREAALEMLNQVRIPRPEQILKDYPHRLSGGMLQRVMIAIALINKPKLLIADEPTTALDVTIQAQILDLMGQLRDSYDTSVIMITHDLGVIAETCEEVAVFYAGQLVEQASVVDIFHNSAHPYTRGLLRSVTSLGQSKGHLLSIGGTVPTAGNFSKGCRFADRCDKRFDKCDTACPPVVELESGHLCRCWLHTKDTEEVST